MRLAIRYYGGGGRVLTRAREASHGYCLSPQAPLRGSASLLLADPRRGGGVSNGRTLGDADRLTTGLPPTWCSLARLRLQPRACDAAPLRPGGTLWRARAENLSCKGDAPCHDPYRPGDTKPGRGCMMLVVLHGLAGLRQTRARFRIVEPDRATRHEGKRETPERPSRFGSTALCLHPPVDAPGPRSQDRRP